MDRIQEISKSVVAAVTAVGAVVSFFVAYDPALPVAIGTAISAAVAVYAIWRVPNQQAPVFDEGAAPDEVEG